MKYSRLTLFDELIRNIQAEDGKFQSILWEFDVSKIIENSVLNGFYSPFSRISSIPPILFNTW